MIFGGCGGSSSSQQSADTQAEQTASTAAESTVEAAAESTEESADGSYKIYVLDANDGTPIEGAKVQFCSDTQCMMADTDKEGLATFDQEPGDYTAHLLVAPQGYEGTEEEIALTADERTATFEIGKTEGTDSTAAADQGESELPATEQIKQQKEWTAEKTGFTFEVPEYVKDLKGEYNIGDNGVAYSEDGTYVAAFTYTPKTAEDYKELEAKAQGATQEETMALQMDYYKNMRSIFNVFAVKEGTDLSTTTIAGMDLPELGTAGGYTYYYQLLSVEDVLAGLKDV